MKVSDALALCTVRNAKRPGVRTDYNDVDELPQAEASQSHAQHEICRRGADVTNN